MDREAAEEYFKKHGLHNSDIGAHLAGQRHVAEMVLRFYTDEVARYCMGCRMMKDHSPECVSVTALIERLKGEA